MDNLEPYQGDETGEKSLGPTLGGSGPRNMDPASAVDADLDRVVLEGIPTVNLGRGVPDPTPFGSMATPNDPKTVRRVLRRISGGRYGNDVPAEKPTTQATETIRNADETGRVQRRFRNLADRLRKPKEAPTTPTQPTASPAKQPMRDVYGGDDAIIFDQAEQLAIHEAMADSGDWKAIHDGHYDWWAYPIDRGSAAYGEFYNIAGEPLQRLRKNQAFLDSVADAIKIQAEALAWSLYERKFVEDPDWDGGQDWRKAYATRIWKMTRSAQILGLEDEFESLKIMQRSLADAGINFNHRKYWENPGTVNDVPPLDSAYERSKSPAPPSSDPYPSLFDTTSYATQTRTRDLTPEQEEALWQDYDNYEMPTDPVLRAADELSMLLSEKVEDDDLSYPYLDIRRDDRYDIADLLSFAGTLLPASPGDGLEVDRSETAYALAKVLEDNKFYEDDVSTIETLIEVLDNPDLLNEDFTFDDPTASMADTDKPSDSRFTPWQLHRALGTNVPMAVVDEERRFTTPMAILDPMINENYLFRDENTDTSWVGFYDWNPEFAKESLGAISDVERNYHDAMRREIVEQGGYSVNPGQTSLRPTGPIDRRLAPNQPWYHGTNVEFLRKIADFGLSASRARESRDGNGRIWLASTPSVWIDQMPIWQRPISFLRLRLGADLERELFSLPRKTTEDGFEYIDTEKVNYSQGYGTMRLDEASIPPELIEVLNQNGEWVPIKSITNFPRFPGIPTRPMLDAGDPTASMASSERAGMRKPLSKNVTQEDLELIHAYESGEVRMFEVAERLDLTPMAISRRYAKARKKIDSNLYEALGFKTPSGIPAHLRPKRRFPKQNTQAPSVQKPKVILTELDNTLMEAFKAGITIPQIANALGVPPSEARRLLDIAHRKSGLKTPTERRDSFRAFMAEEVAMMRKRGLTKPKIMEVLGLSDSEYSRLIQQRRQEVSGWFPSLTDDEFRVAEMYFVDLVPLDGIASRIAKVGRGNAVASIESREKTVMDTLNSAVRKLETGRTAFGDDQESLVPGRRTDRARSARIENFVARGEVVRSADLVATRSGRMSRRIVRNSSATEDPTASMSAEEGESFDSLRQLSSSPLILPHSDRSPNSLHENFAPEGSDNPLRDFLNGPFVRGGTVPKSPDEARKFLSSVKDAGLGAYFTQGHDVPKVQGPVFFQFADMLVGGDMVDRAISTAYPRYEELVDIYAANAIAMANLMSIANSDDIQAIIGSILTGKPLTQNGEPLWSYGPTYDSRQYPAVRGVNPVSLFEGPVRKGFMDLVLDSFGIPDVDRQGLSYGWPQDEPIDFSRFVINDNNPLARFARNSVDEARQFLADYEDFARKWASAARKIMSENAGLNEDQMRKAIETHWRNSGFAVTGGYGTVLRSAAGLAHHSTAAAYAPIVHLEGPETPEIPLHEFFHQYLGQGFTRHGEYAAFRGPWEVYDSWGSTFQYAMNNNFRFTIGVIREEMRRRAENAEQLGDFIRREISARVEKILQSAADNGRYGRLINELIPGAANSDFSRLRSFLSTATEPWQSVGWNRATPGLPKATTLVTIPGASVPKWLWPFGNGSFGGVKRYIDPDTGTTMEYDPITRTYSENPDRS